MSTAALAINGALLGALLAVLGTAANPGLLVLACASAAGLVNVAVRRRLRPASLRAADEKIVQYLVLCSLVVLSWSLLGSLVGLATACLVALLVGLSLAIDGCRRHRRRP